MMVTVAVVITVVAVVAIVRGLKIDNDCDGYGKRKEKDAPRLR